MLRDAVLHGGGGERSWQRGGGGRQGDERLGRELAVVQERRAETTTWTPGGSCTPPGRQASAGKSPSNLARLGQDGDAKGRRKATGRHARPHGQRAGTALARIAVSEHRPHRRPRRRRNVAAAGDVGSGRCGGGRGQACCGSRLVRMHPAGMRGGHAWRRVQTAHTFVQSLRRRGHRDSRSSGGFARRLTGRRGVVRARLGTVWVCGEVSVGREPPPTFIARPPRRACSFGPWPGGSRPVPSRWSSGHGEMRPSLLARSTAPIIYYYLESVPHNDNGKVVVGDNRSVWRKRHPRNLAAGSLRACCS